MESVGTLPVGTQIGHFRIVRLIGRGGFGITYEAWDANLNRPVAIKEYFPFGLANRASDSALVEYDVSHAQRFSKGLTRFLDEARTLAQFRDPRIVHVHGFQEALGTAYMIMDFERGDSLRDVVLRRGALPVAEARSALIDLLRGLRVIHARNYLHRDIKPANLLRRPDGHLVLLDFGSARLAQSSEGDDTHTVIVSQGYAPYEQYDAQGAQGPATDLYATGASLLFFLSGEDPPDGFRRALAVHRDQDDPLEPAIKRITTTETGDLAAMVRWLMQPQPERRPRDAQEVLDRLGASSPTLGMVDAPEEVQAAVDLANLRAIPAKSVEPMRLHLEAQIGAQATPLLVATIRAARNAQDLIDRIAAKIPESVARGRVTAGLVRILSGGPAETPATGVRKTSQSSAATSTIDGSATRHITSALAKHIGPIAAMLVRKRAAKALSRGELVDQLADEIGDPADRAAFRKELARLLALP